MCRCGSAEHLMHEGDRDRTLSHRRRHPLDVAGPNVAHGEHAGPAGLEQVWRARERPARRGQLLAREIRARLDEPLRIEHYATIEPPRARHGSGHDEDVLDVVSLDVSRLIPPAHALELRATLEGLDLRARMQGDGGIVFDAADQVA